MLDYSELNYPRCDNFMYLLELYPFTSLFLASLWDIGGRPYNAKAEGDCIPGGLKEERETCVALQFLPLIC